MRNALVASLFALVSVSGLADSTKCKKAAEQFKIAVNQPHGTAEKQGYLEVIALCPELAEAHYNLGVLEEQAGNLSVAQEYYLASNRARANERALASAAKVAVMGKHADAPQLLAELKTLYPQGVQASFLEGVVALQAGDAARARGLFAAVTKADPSNADAYANAGLAYQKLSSTAEAEQSFLDALAQDPNHPVALYGYGQVQLQRGNFAKAFEAAQVLSQAHATMVSGWELLGAVQLAQGDPERAELAFKKAFELGNGSAAARLGLARVLLMKKQPAQALKMVEGVAADDSVYLTVVGAAHGELGDLAQAKALLSQAVAKDPGSPIAQYNLGVVLERLQEFAAAKESYSAALKLDPTLEQAEQALRRL